jgi:hypothetical protein
MINRAWNVLCWNIRGLNDKDKWDSIRNKIEESCANIFYLQETKREDIDLQFICNFAPKRFDKFEFSPSVGASGGILVCWASNHFSGSTVEKHPFSIDLKILSIHSQISWILLWCMALVDSLLEISLFNGFLICKLRMMSSGCLWGILIFIDLLKTVIKLGVIFRTH